MKRTISLALATIMVFSLTACSANNKSQSSAAQSSKQSTTVSKSSTAQSSSENPNYNFDGYTSTANWPTAKDWADLGLPDLPMKADVSGNVSISTKDWISRLGGEDGLMVEAKPGSTQIEGMLAAIKGAGIELEKNDGFQNGYTGYYKHNGKNMKIDIAEYPDYDIYILVVINPEDADSDE